MLRTPDPVQELAARVGTPGVGGEHREEVELLGSEVDGPAARRSSWAKRSSSTSSPTSTSSPARVGRARRGAPAVRAAPRRRPRSKAPRRTRVGAHAAGHRRLRRARCGRCAGADADAVPGPRGRRGRPTPVAPRRSRSSGGRPRAGTGTPRDRRPSGSHPSRPSNGPSSASAIQSRRGVCRTLAVGIGCRMAVRHAADRHPGPITRCWTTVNVRLASDLRLGHGIRATAAHAARRRRASAAHLRRCTRGPRRRARRRELAPSLRRPYQMPTRPH